MNNYFFFPSVPDVPPSQIITAPIKLMFEDVSQDARLLFNALPYAVGELMWRGIFQKLESTNTLRSRGIVPILSRFIAQLGGGPISVNDPVQAEGRYQLAHTVDETGQVNRILINMWVELFDASGQQRPAMAREGWPSFGRIFAEHVFTRPFEAPGERKVLSFEGHDGLPDLPQERYQWQAPSEMLFLPDRTVILEPKINLDSAPVVFGLQHTDLNQHVNSLVYVRLFEEAALRRFSELNHSTRVLPTFVDIAYRKPCFAGDEIRFAVRTFELDGHLSAVGAYVAQSDLLNPTIQSAQPYGYVRMRFSE